MKEKIKRGYRGRACEWFWLSPMTVDDLLHLPVQPNFVINAFLLQICIMNIKYIYKVYLYYGIHYIWNCIKINALQRKPKCKNRIQ